MPNTTLPHQHRPRPPLEDGPRRRYHLSTNEALDGQKVVSLKDDSARVVWTKTRDLTDDEIVDTVFDSLRKPRWTIHRPRNGWYLILRSPSLPETSFVSLKPSTSHPPSHFNFVVRSVLIFPSSPSKLEDEVKQDSVRLDFSAGDQTPTALSPASFGGEKDGAREPETSKSHFRLQPGLPKHTHRVSSNPFSISSFTGLFADRGKTWSCVWEDESEAEVMRFEEETSLVSMTTKGTLLLNESLVGVIGMEPTFWVAIALAYLEFLEDQEAYGAASGGD